ncbi:hypothetical protein WJX79_010106 [Trebouxia sp. C0005]
MGCFGRKKQEPVSDTEQVISTHRRCRDLIYLILFAAFWGGMVYVAYLAFHRGKPERLEYGVDSYGNLCGVKNDWDGTGGPDLTLKTKLYYLNPLELLNPETVDTAKAICVEECPAAADVCGIAEFPCTTAAQYRCPYYRTAEDGLYGTLTITADEAGYADTYWDSLTTTTLGNSQCGIDQAGFPDKYKSVFLADPSNPTCGQWLQFTSQYPGSGPCYPVLVQTVDHLNRCFPNFDSALLADVVTAAGLQAYNGSATLYSSTFASASQRLQRYIADIHKGILIILVAGLAAGMFLSLIWMVLLRFAAGLMAWAAVLSVNIFCAACTMLAFLKSGIFGTSHFYALGSSVAAELTAAESTDASDRKAWLIVAYIMAACTAILILLTLLMLRRVKVAIACIKVASQAVSTMPSLFFFPIIPFIMTVCLIVYWVAVAGYLYSAGTITAKTTTASSSTALTISALYDAASSGASPPPPSPPPPPPPAGAADLSDAACANNPTCYYTMEWDKKLEYLFIYHFFGLLWTNQFIVGFGYVTIAGAVAHFYWSKGERDRMPRFPVGLALKNTIKYHLGSVALGSFVVALIQFVRFLLEYLEKKSKIAQAKAGVAGAFVKYLMCCVNCCMWYLEKVVKFINRNAYIMVAVHGSGYCSSAFHAAKLILSNILRIAAVNTIGDALLWLGKISVCAGCGVIAFLMSDLTYYTNATKYPATYLSSPLLPILISLLVGYTVAQCFFNVYEMAIDTILLSFCEDCESHNGDPQYAPLLLLGAIGKQVLVKERKLTKKETEAQAKRTKELSRNKELYSIKAHSASGPAV